MDIHALDYLVHFANILLLVAYSLEDILWLGWFAVAAAAIWIGRAFERRRASDLRRHGIADPRGPFGVIPSHLAWTLCGPTDR